MPVFLTYGTPVRPTGNRYSRIVLLSPVDSVRKLIVGDNSVKLRGYLVALSRPRCSSIKRDIRTTIIGIDHYFRIHRIYPQVMLISMWNRYGSESLTSIYRFQEWSIHDVYKIHIIGVSIDLHVIPGTSLCNTILRYLSPRLTSVIRPIDSTFTFGFYYGIQYISICS